MSQSYKSIYVQYQQEDESQILNKDNLNVDSFIKYQSNNSIEKNSKLKSIYNNFLKIKLNKINQKGELNNLKMMIDEFIDSFIICKLASLNKQIIDNKSKLLKIIEFNNFLKEFIDLEFQEFLQQQLEYEINNEQIEYFDQNIDLLFEHSRTIQLTNEFQLKVLQYDCTNEPLQKRNIPDQDIQIFHNKPLIYPDQSQLLQWNEYVQNNKDIIPLCTRNPDYENSDGKCKPFFMEDQQIYAKNVKRDGFLIKQIEEFKIFIFRLKISKKQTPYIIISLCLNRDELKLKSEYQTKSNPIIIQISKEDIE